MGIGSTIVAYCGVPATPLDLWSRWRFDPCVIAVFTMGAGLYALGRSGMSRDDVKLSSGPAKCFYLGITVALLALLSPLCALSVSLFSARVAQHIVLLMVAAPLVAAGNPALVSMFAFGVRPGRDAGVRRASPRHSMVAAGAFAIFVWAWHVPTLYATTFDGSLCYWLMHISMFACAVFLWSTLLDRTGDPWERMLAGLSSAVQMGLLGALITFAPHPLYAPHFLTTDAWGLVPLQDQQLGGVIMWVPGCGVFLLVALLDMWRALSNPSTVSRAPAR
jgi:putative membrane protein